MEKIKLELTEPQFRAVINLVDSISAQIGSGGDIDIEWNQNIKLFDRMMKKNGYKRAHN
jgi:hypothetical protein